MPKRDQSASSDRQAPPSAASEKGREQKGFARPGAEARSWANVNKLPGGSKKIASGRKVPNGPVGGSGRKTNLARSS
jgi:hypothetical protein